MPRRDGGRRIDLDLAAASAPGIATSPASGPGRAWLGGLFPRPVRTRSEQRDLHHGSQVSAAALLEPPAGGARSPRPQATPPSGDRTASRSAPSRPPTRAGVLHRSARRRSAPVCRGNRGSGRCGLVPRQLREERAAAVPATVGSDARRCAATCNPLTTPRRRLPRRSHHLPRHRSRPTCSANAPSDLSHRGRAAVAEPRTRCRGYRRAPASRRAASRYCGDLHEPHAPRRAPSSS